MSPSWGKCSPLVKEHIPRSTWNDFPVVKKTYTPPRKVLAENLAELLQKTGWSGPELASRAKIDRKSVNNMLNGRYDPRPEKVDAVATAFGLTGWLLLRAGTGKAYVADEISNIERLIDVYNAATSEQRATIMRVAEMAGPYTAK